MSIRAVYGAPPPPPPTNKRYLGDGVYAEFDGYQIWLTTSNGLFETNKIALDGEVLAGLIAYVDTLRPE